MADRCTVLRRGKYMGTVDVGSTTIAQLAELMVGRQVSFITEKKMPIQRRCIDSGRLELLCK